ncbi:MAG: diguanylate cyclase/phosphodiesterase with sensor(s) [Frankiales bacterium]|nr:diguanylate cyclase/phosphodiesterase with sensor(s) [Frankiales bacterium]
MPRARPSSATVSLAVDDGGVVRACEWHSYGGVERRELAGRRLTDLVAPDDRHLLTKLFLGATSTGSRARCLVQADLGDGPQPASITVDDRVADLGVIIVRVLRLAEAAEELDALAQLAFWDPLTGLANRALFGEHLRNELERGRRSGRFPAVLSADVDKLKGVNDRFGHRAGDALLVEVGRRLRSACRPFDVPARLSGDEYAVLCPEVDNENDAHQLVQRLTQAIAGPALLCGEQVSIGISVGWALGRETDHEDDGAMLLHRADVSMYGVKRLSA